VQWQCPEIRRLTSAVAAAARIAISESDWEMKITDDDDEKDAKRVLVACLRSMIMERYAQRDGQVLKYRLVGQLHRAHNRGGGRNKVLLRLAQRIQGDP